MRRPYSSCFSGMLIVAGCFSASPPPGDSGAHGETSSDSGDASDESASSSGDEGSSSGEDASTGEEEESSSESSATTEGGPMGESSDGATTSGTSTTGAQTTDESSTSDANEESGTSGDDSGEPVRSAGCDQDGPQSDRYTIDVDGMAREYILRLPDGYDSSRAYPLVFAWHPWGGSADQVASGNYHGLVGAAGDATILVAADGLDFGGNGQGWGNENGRDMALMRAMHARFVAELCVDESRVFSTGFSFGGMMSFALGCGAADLVRAIAPMAGNTAVAGCESGDLPVAMMGFHGNMDTVVDISGGQTGRDILRERNGCSETTVPADTDWCEVGGGNLQPCTCVSYEGCDAGYPVIWCEFTGGHTAAPNAGATLWSFFSQF